MHIRMCLHIAELDELQITEVHLFTPCMGGNDMRLSLPQDTHRQRENEKYTRSVVEALNRSRLG